MELVRKKPKRKPFVMFVDYCSSLKKFSGNGPVILQCPFVESFMGQKPFATGELGLRFDGFIFLPVFLHINGGISSFFAIPRYLQISFIAGINRGYISDMAKK